MFFFQFSYPCAVLYALYPLLPEVAVNALQCVYPQ